MVSRNCGNGGNVGIGGISGPAVDRGIVGKEGGTSKAPPPGGRRLGGGNVDDRDAIPLPSPPPPGEGTEGTYLIWPRISPSG